MPDEPDTKDTASDAPRQAPPARATPRNSSQDALLKALSEVEKEPRPTLIAGTERHFKISNPRPDSIQPSHGKKKLIILSLGIIILLISGVAGTAFALWYTNPDKVVSDAVVNVATARTTIADGSYRYKDDKNNGSIELTFTSKADTPNFKGQLDANLKVNYDKYKFNLAGSGLVSEKGDVYVKFDGIEKALENYLNDEPDILFYVETSPELKKDILALAAKLDGQWVKLDQAAVKNIWVNFDHGKTKACFAKAYDEFDKNPSQKSEITNIYDQNRFIVIQNKGSEKVNNVDSLKYNVTADMAKYYKASDAFEKTNLGKATATCTDQRPSPSSKIEKQIQKNQDHEIEEDKEVRKKSRDRDVKEAQKELDKAKLTVWVSRWGHEFTKTSFVRDDTKEKTHITLDINYKINQQINAKEPAKSIPLKEFQADIHKIEIDLYGTSQEQAVSATNEDNAATIARKAELFAADKNGRPPTIEELKAATGAAALTPELRAVISTAMPDAANPDRIHYKPCGKEYDVYYWDAVANKALASYAALGCYEQTT